VRRYEVPGAESIEIEHVILDLSGVLSDRMGPYNSGSDGPTAPAGSTVPLRGVAFEADEPLDTKPVDDSSVRRAPRARL
jgi:hypothetical protein